MKRIALVSLIAVATLSAAELTGTVGENAGALPAAKVEIESKDGKIARSVVTDMEGRFRTLDLPAGSYDVTFSYLGYADSTISIDIAEDGSVQNIGTLKLTNRVQKMSKISVVGTMQRDQARAQMIQRNSDQIKNVIASDRIGKLPDRNAAEAVQRVAGVSIEKDQGEGRFVAVRGLPKDWNTATLNGNRIPAAEEEDLGRGAAFDFFPTDLIEYIEVSKALTPDMEMDALGGSVNYRTKTAPDEQTLTASAAGGFGSKEIGSGEYAPGHGSANASLLYGNRFADGKLGLLVNGTYWRRAWATDNWENRIGNDGVGIYRTELRDYTGVRQTYGANGALDYKFNDNHKVQLLGMFGSLNDEELHYKHRLRYDKVKADEGVGRVEIQNIHNILITQFWGGELSSEHRFNDLLKLDLSLAHYENEFKYGNVPDDVDNSYFVLQYNDGATTSFSGLQYDRVAPDGSSTGKSYAYFDADKGKMPSGSNLNTHISSTGETITDVDELEFATVGIYRVAKTEKDNIVAAADLEITPSDMIEFKIGGKFRDKERVESFSDEYWKFRDGVDAPAYSSLNLIDAQPGQEDYLKELGGDGFDGSKFGKVVEKDAISKFWTDNKSNMVLDSTYGVGMLWNGGGNGRNYSLNEKHVAGYGQAKLSVGDRFSAVGGLRLEKTLLNIDGYVTTVDESPLANVDGTISNVLNPETGEYNRTDKVTDNKSDYMSVLPAINAKLSPAERLNVRAAYSRTFSRPNFGDIVPGGFTMSFDNTKKVGNPELEPTYSNNFDLMAEYFFEGVGYVSGGVFGKVISDAAYTGTKNIEENGENVKVSQPLNSKENAYLAGFELGFSKKFDFIPNKVLSGFGLEANYTFTHSEMTIDERETRLPRQADNLFNTAVFYELGGFNARLAGNFKGAYIMEHGDKNIYDETEYLDEYYDKNFNLDFSTSYSFNKHVTVFAEVSNILNTPMVYTLGDPEKGRQIQTEYYGVKSLLGVKASIF